MHLIFSINTHTRTKQIKIMHYKDMETHLAAADPEYVPRPVHYRQHLWAYLDNALGGKK